jgi:hypothetical protein
MGRGEAEVFFPGLVGQPRLRRGVEVRVAGVSRSALM